MLAHDERNPYRINIIAFITTLDIILLFEMEVALTVSTLEQRAMEFAAHYHGIIDHRRKYTGEPYIEHPKAVVKLVKDAPHTPAMLAAAWLHDVVEDTPATIDEVRQTFGAEIAGLVRMLTNVSRPEDGNRATRKSIDRAHIAMASREAKTIATLTDALTKLHAASGCQAGLREQVA